MKFLGLNLKAVTAATSALLILAAVQGCKQDYAVKADSKSTSGTTGGTGGGGPSGPVSQIDSFNVAAPGSATKADILFVIDNSGSMEDEQTALANAFNSFISVFVSKGVDYHIGIISTDSRGYANVPITNDPANVPSPKPQGWTANPFFGFHNPFPTAGSTAGTLLVKDTYAADPKFISPSTGNNAAIIDRFKNNAKLRIYGSGDERVIYNALQALDPKKLREENSGFRRADALLSIVGVTDENEQIKNDPVSWDGQFVGNETTPQQRIDRFKAKMPSICGVNCPGWRVDLIVDVNATAPNNPVS